MCCFESESYCNCINKTSYLKVTLGIDSYNTCYQYHMLTSSCNNNKLGYSYAVLQSLSLNIIITHKINIHTAVITKYVLSITIFVILI